MSSAFVHNHTGCVSTSKCNLTVKSTVVQKYYTIAA